MTNRIRGRRARLMAATAAVFALTLGTALPAHADQTVVLKPLVCGWGWVNVDSTSAGHVYHRVNGGWIQSNVYMGWSPNYTPWHSSHVGHMQANHPGSHVTASLAIQVHSVKRYCGA